MKTVNELEEYLKSLYSPPSRKGGRADQANVTVPLSLEAGSEILKSEIVNWTCAQLAVQSEISDFRI
jgi:hypothetical protein